MINICNTYMFDDLTDNDNNQINDNLIDNFIKDNPASYEDANTFEQTYEQKNKENNPHKDIYSNCLDIIKYNIKNYFEADDNNSSNNIEPLDRILKENAIKNQSGV